MKKHTIAMGVASLLALAATASLSSCGGTQAARYKPGEKIKVGLICLHGESSTYDKNFIDAFRGAFANNAKVIFDESCIKTDVPEEPDCYEAAKALVKQGCNLIFADSFGHGDYIKQAAEEWPQVEFCHATGTAALTGGVNNFHNAFASIYEGRYLAGMAAGYKLLEEGYSATDAVKVGYVGAWPYAEVKSGYTSWFLGLRRVLANATMEVEFTNSWYDEPGEREKANSLIGKGCVLISQHADSMGAPSACQNHNPKIPNVTYNISTETACPDTYVAHSAINWAPYYTTVADSMFAGRAIEGEVGRNWTGSLKSGSVVFEASQNNLNAAHRQLLADKKEELTNAADSRTIIWNVADFTVDASKNPGTQVDAEGHLTSYLADTDGDFVGDTEVVLDNGEVRYFSESSFCSAPYFAIDIDGITIA